MIQLIAFQISDNNTSTGVFEMLLLYIRSLHGFSVGCCPPNGEPATHYQLLHIF